MSKSQYFINALAQPVFKTISKAASTLHVDSYVIGGFVRDYLLNRGASKDIDVVAVGSGIQLAKKVSELLPGKPKVSVFKNYGTAMLKALSAVYPVKFMPTGGVNPNNAKDYLAIPSVLACGGTWMVPNDLIH